MFEIVYMEMPHVSVWNSRKFTFAKFVELECNESKFSLGDLKLIEIVKMSTCDAIIFIFI